MNGDRQQDAAGDAGGRNPYQAPANAASPPPPKPAVAPWVLACSAIGAAVLGLAEYSGKVGSMSASLPRGVGGAAVGFCIGAICGRVIGRLMVAWHSFEVLRHRDTERREELEERRGR